MLTRHVDLCLNFSFSGSIPIGYGHKGFLLWVELMVNVFIIEMKDSFLKEQAVPSQCNCKKGGP